MTTISDVYDNLDLTVTSRNEQLVARLHGRANDVTITVLPGHAERVGTAEMETQLALLARDLFVSRTVKIHRLNRSLLDAGKHEPKPEEAAYREAYAEMAVTGRSRDDSVRATCVGLSHWAVDIQGGAIDRYGSHGLSTAATEAASDLIARLQHAVKDLRHDYFKKHD